MEEARSPVDLLARKTVQELVKAMAVRYEQLFRALSRRYRLQG
ncbi:hypothetical protein V6C53_19890 [Desulfocurvibacter africanus]